MSMQCGVLYAPWRIERASSARQGTRGPSCSGCWPAHPEIEVVHVTADTNAGAVVAELYPSLAACVPGARLAPLDARRPRGPRPRVLACCRTASPAPRCPAARRGRARHRPRRRLPAPAATYARGTARRTRAPELIDQFAYGLVELYRDDLAAHAHVAAPGCYPTAVSLALRAAPRGRARGASRAHRRTRSRCLGRGPRPQDDELVLRGQRERRGVRPADASPHGRDGAGADEGRAAPTSSCCSRRISCRRHAASSPRVTPVPQSTVFDTAPARALPRVLRATIRSSRWSTSRRARRPPTARTSRTSPCASTLAPTPWSRSRREDNLVKGASGQMIQAANAVLGLPETTGLPRDRDRAVSVTAPAGFVASGLACRDQGLGRSRSRARRDGRSPFGRGGGRVHHEPRAGRAGADHAAHLADGRAAAVVLSSGNANAATGEAGRRDALRMCELVGDAARRRPARRARVLDRAHRDPDADGADLEAGIPKLCRGIARRRGRCGRRAGAMLTTDTVRKDATVQLRSTAVRPRPSAAWQRVRRCSRPRWRRCSPCSPPTPPSSPTRCTRAARARST